MMRMMRQRFNARPPLSPFGQGVVTSRYAERLSPPGRERFTMMTPAQQLQEARYGKGRVTAPSDIGPPTGEAVFPGVVGKIPGLRTPAEAAATIGTAGMGSIPMAAKAGGLALGLGGAFGGGEVAERTGIPRPIGEVVGGLGGGLAGGVAGPIAARRIGTNLDVAAERAGGTRELLGAEVGGSRLPRRVTPETEEIGPVAKLTNLIRQARPVRAETEALKGAELGRRAGLVSQEIAQERGKAGLGAARAQMRGELPRAQFEPVEAALGKGEVDDLFNAVWRSPRQPFEKVNTADALEGILSGRLPTRGEIAMLEDTFGTEFAQALLSKRTLGRRAWENFVDVLNLPRAVKSSWDASAPLRQAVVLTVSRPRQSVPAMGRMTQAIFSERTARAVEDAIANSPYAALKQRSGLYIAPRRGAGAQLGEREEAFMSSLAQKIPGLRQSERGYVTYLNKLRSDVFDAVAQGWEGVERTPKDYRDLASWLNHATGRGDLGFLKGAAPILNATFFSPRLLASRLQMPVDLLISTPAVRKEVARDLGTSVATGLTILALAKYSGAADVNLNPQSPDFGKLKMGKQRIDFWGGFQPIARYAAQAASGAVAGDKDKVQRTLLRFLRSKLAPVPAFGVDVWEGETFTGEEVDPDAETARQQLMPMFLKDIEESVQEEGIVGGIRAIPGILGVGVDAYKPWTNPRYPPEFKQLSPGDQQQLTDFLDRVEETREHWRETGTDTRSITWDETIDEVAKYDKITDPNFIEWAKVLQESR